MDEDIGIFEDGFHLVRICHEIWRQISAVKLHTFDHVQRGFRPLRFFNSNDAVFSDFFHRVCDDVPISHRCLQKLSRPGRSFPYRHQRSCSLRFSSFNTAFTARSIPRFKSIGFAPAVTFFKPSLLRLLEQEQLLWLFRPQLHQKSCWRPP